ncbi:ABC transporter ATP-binding protein [Rhizobium tubonense]|uniref:ABC transporter ATP-binding protein n=1 Tax=Rhizobium tubonense TaxID=484088 RepID=UPI001FCE7585|nr:ABC transporter ATP-binding protein [Rhizobium tubonense]
MNVVRQSTAVGSVAAQTDPLRKTLPQTLYGFVVSISGLHQIAIAALSALLFIVGTAPLEIQRRIVNATTEGGSYKTIAMLISIYLGLALAEGLIKVWLNIYRNWVGEVAIRWLRLSIFAAAEGSLSQAPSASDEGIQLSIVVAEAEPVGGFVGQAISEPLLQIGILASVIGYMLYLQPLMGLVVAVVFFPQVGFVPLMQSAINRRVESKIVVMREVSAGIVDAGSAKDHDGIQYARIGELFSLDMSVYKIKFSMNFLMNFMMQLGYAGIFALGGYYVITGKTEIGTVVAFVSGLSKINDPWGDLVNWYRDLKVTQVKYGLIRDSAQIEVTQASDGSK